MVASTRNRVCGAESKTTTGFILNVKGPQSGNDADITADRECGFVVNCTNAQLPDTVTQEQIEAAINNPGVSAWGAVESDGTLNSGLNISSVTRTGTGTYDVVFTTSMPSANYAVNATGLQENRMPYVTTQSATGFTVGIETLAGAYSDGKFGFVVFA